MCFVCVCVCLSAKCYNHLISAQYMTSSPTLCTKYTITHFLIRLHSPLVNRSRTKSMHTAPCIREISFSVSGIQKKKKKCLKITRTQEKWVRSTYSILGVSKYDAPPNSCGYLNFKKKYKWPTIMPISENISPLDKIKLKASNTHGRYIALKRVPNQNVTITSLFIWHQTYSTDKTIGSISICTIRVTFPFFYISLNLCVLTVENHQMVMYLPEIRLRHRQWHSTTNWKAT